MNKKIKIVGILNLFARFIIENAYIDDYDGDDEEGKPIIRKVYKGLEEKDIKSLLEGIDDIIELVKESE